MSTSNVPYELRGEAAIAFAAKHLREVGSDPKTWEVFYLDGRTGESWVMDYPDSEQHGGGSPRLRKRAR